MHDRFMEIPEACCTTFPPIGTLPSRNVIDRNATESILGFKEQYELNEWTLMGTGDILLLFTDGVTEHATGKESYVPEHLEKAVRSAKHGSARDIFEAVRDDMMGFAPPSDDVSLVVIKKQ